MIEADEIARKAGYSRPHTVHCGPDGIYVSALRQPGGRRARRRLPARPRRLHGQGQWEVDRGRSSSPTTSGGTSPSDIVITSEWGTPDMFEDGLVGELLLGNKYGHRLHVWDLAPRKHVQELDLGDQHQMMLELRPAHDPTKGYGFVGVVTSTPTWQRLRLALEPRRGRPRVGREGASRSRPSRPRPSSSRRSCSRSARSRRSSPTSTCRSTTVPLRLLLGDRRAAAVRRERPVRAARTGIGADGRHRRARGAPDAGRSAAGRRWSRCQPRRPARLRHQLALRSLGRPVLPRGHRRLARQARRRARTAGSTLDPSVPGRLRRRARRTRSASRAATPPPTPTASRIADGRGCGRGC